MAGPWEKYGAVEAAPAGPWSKYAGETASTADDVAKSAGIGVVKGGLTMLGLPGDLRNLVSAGVDYAGRAMGADPEAVGRFKDQAYTAAQYNPMLRPFTNPGSAEIQQQVEGVTGKFYEPKTVAGEYARTIGEFVPGAAIGPGGAVARGAQVVIPALASESAGQLTKGSPAEPWARGGAALVTGGLTSLASRPGTASRALREALPEGVTPQMVDRAEVLIQDAAQRGIQLAWPEALSQVAGRPILTNTMRHLEAAPQTEAQMAEFFGRRPGQVEGAARQQFDNIAPANQQPSTIGPAVGQAAEETLTDVRGAINRDAEPLYTAASQQRMDPATMARIRAAPGWEEASAAVRNNPQLARYVAGQPDDSIGFLNEVQKYLAQQADNAAAPVAQNRNMQVSAGYGVDRNLVRDSATRQSPELAQAIAREAANRAQFLDPLLQGPLGKIAGRDTGTKAAIDALFPANPLPNSADEISTTVSALSRRNPRAATDLVRAHVESTFNEAAQDLATTVGGNQRAGAKFRAVLVGNPQQAENLEAAVTALPNGAERWRGFSRLLDIFEATAARENVGSKTAYNSDLLRSQASSGLVGEGAKALTRPLQALDFIAVRYERYRLGRNLGELANILTDPGSANQLRAIARMPPGSQQAINTAARMLTAANSSRGQNTSQPVP